MLQQIKTSVAALIKAQGEVAFYQKQIERIQKNCTHDWTEPKYEPVHTKAYTIPGDPPGTMGVDRQLPTHVPAKTEDKWTRSCKTCGLEQETKRAEEKKTVQKIPTF